MTNMDDNTIRAFLREQRQEIPDQGFSRRVMEHIPRRSSRYSLWWTAGVLIAFFALFFSLDGVYYVTNAVLELWVAFIQALATATFDVGDYLFWLLCLCVWGAHRIWTSTAD
jgi:hypothetical protein